MNITAALPQAETAGDTRMVVLLNKKKLPVLVLLSETMVCVFTLLRTLLHHQQVCQVY